MNSLNKLGLTVALITILVLVVVLGAWWGIRQYWFGSFDAAQDKPAQDEADVSKDSDGDGLPDLVENLYKTDPNNPDSDGDGLLDGAEVQAGRNPLGVDGLGTLGNLPLGSQVTEQNTWTQKYLASLPDDTPQDQILNDERLSAFVNVNKGDLLPTLPDNLVKTSSASGKEAVKTYLDTITPGLNPALTSVTTEEIEAAWRLAYANNQPEAIQDLVTKLHANVDVLEATVVPEELASLHEKIVAAAHGLTNNTELLRDMNKDLVGGLIGAKNIEELGAIFQEIEAEVDKLDAKYNF